MIVKFFARGVGRGSGPVDYLLGKNRDRDQATLDRGDPDVVQGLIDSSPYAKKYTSGVLSFAEPDLDRKTKDDLMTSFEQALFPGLDKDQYSVLWVEHRDKERLELNFVIPNVELTTGKRLQPWFEKADKPRINAWKGVVNAHYGLHDPNDPLNKRELITPRDLPVNKQEAARSITDSLLNLAGTGDVKNRDDVIRTIENAGFTVARKTKNSISIADPEGGRNIRLKGLIYEQDFRHGEGLRAEIERASREYRETAQERLRALHEVYTKGVEIKRAELTKRYQRPQQENEVDNAKDVVLALSERGSCSSREFRRDLVAKESNHSEFTNDQRTERDDRAVEQTRGSDSVQQLRQESVREDRHKRPDLPRRVPDTGRILDDDRTRKAVIERIRGFTERARSSAQKLRHGVQKFREHVQHYIVRERSITPRSEIIKRENERLEQATRAFEQNITEKTRERQKRRGFMRGLGF